VPGVENFLWEGISSTISEGRPDLVADGEMGYSNVYTGVEKSVSPYTIPFP
jgi:hypothetical protein